MKLQNVKDPEKLFEVIDSCSGKVELVTGEGDRLNLKSKLSQYLSLANIFSVKEEIPELELVAYDPNDVKKLIEFMINEQSVYRPEPDRIHEQSVYGSEPDRIHE